jgi:hypothetical protein
MAGHREAGEEEGGITHGSRCVSRVFAPHLAGPETGDACPTPTCLRRGQSPGRGVGRPGHLSEPLRPHASGASATGIAITRLAAVAAHDWPRARDPDGTVAIVRGGWLGGTPEGFIVDRVRGVRHQFDGSLGAHGLLLLRYGVSSVTCTRDRVAVPHAFRRHPPHRPGGHRW